MSHPRDIDRSAPVLSHQEITIRAPMKAVWKLHTNVNAWPRWQTDITSARMDGAFEPDATFEWATSGLTLTSTVYDVADEARTLWGGEGDGITGIHEWVFSHAPEGVHVSTDESFAGAPVVADAGGMQSMLDTSLVTWLKLLKVKAETSYLGVRTQGTRRGL